MCPMNFLAEAFNFPAVLKDSDLAVQPGSAEVGTEAAPCVDNKERQCLCSVFVTFSFIHLHFERRRELPSPGSLLKCSQQPGPEPG